MAMKKTSLLLAVFVIAGTSMFGITWTITNVGTSFSPATLTIQQGDDVQFILDGSHNSLEVSESTYNSNGTTPLSGGWLTPFGGGTVSASFLTVGTHYYVCEPHAAGGMKGTIVVTPATSIDKIMSGSGIDLFPNPTHGLFSLQVEQSIIGSDFKLYNLTGKELAKGKIENERTTINIAQLPKGVYFLSLYGIRNRSIKITKK
jgi:plastocyanin